MTLSITSTDVIGWDLCDGWTPEKIRELAGDKAWTALEILEHPDISPKDKQWLVLRPELIPDNTLRSLACDFAEHVQCNFLKQLPDDTRPQEAIDTARKWLRGEATDTARSAAESAANAAWSAALSAASTAESAALSAASAASAARSAASAARSAASAARSAEIEWQNARIREVLK